MINTSVWDLNPLYKQNHLPLSVTGDDAVVTSLIYHALNTTPGEESRIFKNDVGSHWRMLLQENINDVTAAQIELLIFDSIKKLDPRVHLVRQNSRVEADFSLPGYKIFISYATAGSIIPKTVTFSVPA